MTSVLFPGLLPGQQVFKLRCFWSSATTGRRLILRKCTQNIRTLYIATASRPSDSRPTTNCTSINITRACNIFCRARNIGSVTHLSSGKHTFPLRTQIKYLSMSSSKMDVHSLQPYTAPAWASHLKNAPTEKIQLACLPTPIHRWQLPGLPEGYQVYIKRDDMTGCTLSGNKVRKLEFLLADAVSKGCENVITCGGLQSNHCRAVAVACAQLGLKAHLVLRTDIKDVDELENDGNVLLDRLSGAQIYLVPRKSPQVTHLIPRMEALAAAIEKSCGEKSYVIPAGGSNNEGLWGYLNAFDEMIQQGVVDRFDDIVFACGSGGTAEGLVFGNYLSKSNLGIHGIMVSDDKDYFYSLAEETFNHFGFDSVKPPDVLDLIEGYKGLGYGITRKEELDLIAKVSCQTGIMTDPVYTGKAMYGLIHELQNNAARFKGKRILFIHTGGVFGMYDGKLADWLKSDTTYRSCVQTWPNVDDPAPIGHGRPGC